MSFALSVQDLMLQEDAPTQIMGQFCIDVFMLLSRNGISNVSLALHHSFDQQAPAARPRSWPVVQHGNLNSMVVIQSRTPEMDIPHT